MQLGMIGLGRMGANMVRRLEKNGHQCVVFDRTQATVDALAKEGATGSSSIDDFIKKLNKPRAIWLMVPAAVVDGTLHELVLQARRRRHRHRWRQLLLHRRHSPRQGTEREGHPLRGLRHQRRRLGSRTRLLPDDRRRNGHREASRSDLQNARARHRHD